ncbi:hypothetical protein IE81DRAFT_345906 [Ceraceosorus guamensis]|uniref:DUF1772-domain-containing protein n=1 Tax=Ceraceosorus guamensis TaxID=1522189 RepID=A0A316W3A7_9BASI|nr:hypothetical protein IE81DRAFT_345906 [Ceraceosorus guamensis]PWN44202.1 hypothetical protein IE81DRAFT_345906 [Ceraceosorus guamensis]
MSSQAVSIDRLALHALRFKASTPSALVLGLGFAANSYLFLGNIALAGLGPLPVITSWREELGLRAGQSTVIFKKFYKSATPYFAGSAVLSALSFLATGFLARPLRVLVWPAALVTGAVPIYTYFAMYPNINAICDTADTVGPVKGAIETLSPNEIKQTDERINKWILLNNIRMGLSGTAWLFAFSAVLLY